MLRRCLAEARSNHQAGAGHTANAQDTEQRCEAAPAEEGKSATVGNHKPPTEGDDIHVVGSGRAGEPAMGRRSSRRSSLCKYARCRRDGQRQSKQSLVSGEKRRSGV